MIIFPFLMLMYASKRNHYFYEYILWWWHMMVNRVVGIFSQFKASIVLSPSHHIPSHSIVIANDSRYCISITQLYIYSSKKELIPNHNGSRNNIILENIKNVDNISLYVYSQFINVSLHLLSCHPHYATDTHWATAEHSTIHDNATTRLD